MLGLSGGVHGLTRMTEGQLRRVAGVGPAKAAQILAAVELGRRTLARPPEERARWHRICCRATVLVRWSSSVS